MSAFGLPGVTGVLVLDVQKGSRLETAGLKKNDVILLVNGNRIADTNDLLRYALSSPPAKTLNLIVIRDQKAISLNLSPEAPQVVKP
jgi:S1-C subfamily serine protease